MTVESDETTPLNGRVVSDTPQSNAVDVVVAKVDATPERPGPRAIPALKEPTSPSGTTRGSTWRGRRGLALGLAADVGVATDNDGSVSGRGLQGVGRSLLLRKPTGDASIPLGTVLVTGDEGAQGYNLDDGHGESAKVFASRITEDGHEGSNPFRLTTPRRRRTL